MLSSTVQLLWYSTRIMGQDNWAYKGLKFSQVHTTEGEEVSRVKDVNKGMTVVPNMEYTLGKKKGEKQY